MQQYNYLNNDIGKINSIKKQKMKKEGMNARKVF